jgi:hypothetical protein
MTSTSMFFSSIETRSSPPTCLTPREDASSAFFPEANTAISTFLPKP